MHILFKNLVLKSFSLSLSLSLPPPLSLSRSFLPSLPRVLLESHENERRKQVSLCRPLTSKLMLGVIPNNRSVLSSDSTGPVIRIGRTPVADVRLDILEISPIRIHEQPPIHRGFVKKQFYLFQRRAHLRWDCHGHEELQPVPVQRVSKRIRIPHECLKVALVATGLPAACFVVDGDTLQAQLPARAHHRINCRLQ